MNIKRNATVICDSNATYRHDFLRNLGPGFALGDLKLSDFLDSGISLPIERTEFEIKFKKLFFLNFYLLLQKSGANFWKINRV